MYTVSVCFCLCLGAQMCTVAHMFVCVETQSQCQVCSSIANYVFIELGFLGEPGLFQFCLPCQASVVIPCVCLKCWDSRSPPQLPGFSLRLHTSVLILGVRGKWSIRWVVSPASPFFFFWYYILFKWMFRFPTFGTYLIDDKSTYFTISFFVSRN